MGEVGHTYLEPSKRDQTVLTSAQFDSVVCEDVNDEGLWPEPHSVTRQRALTPVDAGRLIGGLRNLGITGAIGIYVEPFAGRDGTGLVDPEKLADEPEGFGLRWRLASFTEARNKPFVAQVPTYLSEYLPYEKALVIPWANGDRVFGATILPRDELSPELVRLLVDKAKRLAADLAAFDVLWVERGGPLSTRSASIHSWRARCG